MDKTKTMEVIGVSTRRNHAGVHGGRFGHHLEIAHCTVRAAKYVFVTLNQLSALGLQNNMRESVVSNHGNGKCGLNDTWRTHEWGFTIKPL